MNAFASNLSELHEKFARESKSETYSDTRAQTSGLPDQKLAQRLEVNIGNFCASDRSHPKTKNELIRAFSEDVAQLEIVASQWKAFVDELISIHLFNKGIDSLTERDRQRFTGESTELFRKAKQLEIDDGGVLVDKLFAKNFEQIEFVLENQLNAIKSSLAQQIVSKLESLRQYQFLGVISWSSEESCNFSDWRHLVVADVHSEETETLDSHVRQSTPNDNAPTSWGRETKTRRRRTGKFKHIAQQQIQHLMSAKSTRLDRFPLAIPRRFDRLIKTIPEILHSEIRIVSGESFGCKKTTHTFMEKHWVDTQVTTDVAIHDDPAIVIGDTVLVAWDEVVCNREKKEQAADKRFETSIGNWLVALCSMSVSVLLAIFLQPMSVFSNLVALLPFSIIGACFACRGVSDYFAFKRLSIPVSGKIQLFSIWVFVNMSLGFLTIAIFWQHWFAAAIPSIGLAIGLSILFDFSKKSFPKVNRAEVKNG